MFKKIFLLLISIAIVYGVNGFTYRDDSLADSISDKILRFHVIANSDAPKDQQLKLKVKDAIVEYTRPLLAECESLELAKQIVKDNEANIIKLSTKIIKENGYDYDVHIDFEECYFPAKKYGDITFPPGNYDAVRILIGKSCGKNWWCVLYPPLCFVDSVNGIVPDESKNQLEAVLGYEDYKKLIYGSDNNTKISYKFKLLKFLN